jgi:hypothetical protein
MTSILTLAFANPAEFMQAVPGIEANTTFESLNASAVAAKKDMVALLTLDVWTEAVSDDDNKQLLQIAWANLTMYKHVIFTVMKARMTNDKQIYKPEREEMRRQYIDNYYSAMDSLIEAVSSSDAWKQTNYYKLQDKLIIKTIADFESYYPIDNSYLFFYRTMAIQRRTLIAEGFDQSYSMIANRDDLKDKMNTAFVLYVVSLAAAQFDPIALPPTIRDMISDNNSSGGSIDKEAKTRDLAASLAKQSMDIVRSIETALSTPTSDSFASDEDFQQHGDKYLLIP